MRIQLATNQLNQLPQCNFRTSNADPKTAADSSPVEKISKINNTAAITIASITLVVAALMLSRGAQKNINKYLNKFKDYLEEKKTHLSVEKTSKQKMYDHTIRRINSFIKKSESINNITSLKDILFMKLMYKTKPTKEIHQAITSYFEKISQKTVFDSYKKTEAQFQQMNKIFDELDKYIIEKSGNKVIEYGGKQCSVKELIELARGHREDANIAVGVFIDPKTIQTRYKYINEVTSNLYSSFWDASFKDFWSKNNRFKRKEMWQTFIAAEQIRGNKTDLANMIGLARNAITYNKVDQITNVYEYVKAIDSILPAEDHEGISIVKKLEWLSKNPDLFHDNQDLFFAELEKLKEHKININSDPKISETLEKYKQTNIDSIEYQINDNKAGALQDMLSIYYKIAPFELEESGALLELKKAVKSFDKSANLECVEFFDKIRDLKLGSAPTDVLTILFSFVTISFGLGHAKDKDKRTTIMLKSGIPIIGGIATTMFTAAKLVSGGKSLAVGFLSALMLNQIGKISNNLVKDIKTEKSKDKNAV